MRVHVSQTTLKRVEKLDAPLRAEHNRGAFVLALHHGIPMPRGAATLAQMTVLSWPRVATDMDAWEREASAQQDRLIADSAEDRSTRETTVVTTVKPDPHRECERLYQQEKKDQVQVLKDYRDAGQQRVRKETMR